MAITTEPGSVSSSAMTTPTILPPDICRLFPTINIPLQGCWQPHTPHSNRYSKKLCRNWRYHETAAACMPYCTMDMTFWLSQAEATLAQIEKR